MEYRISFPLSASEAFIRLIMKLRQPDERTIEIANRALQMLWLRDYNRQAIRRQLQTNRKEERA